MLTASRFIAAMTIVIALVVSPRLTVAGGIIVHGTASGAAARTTTGTLESIPEVVLPDEGGHVEQEAGSSIVLPDVMSIGTATVSTTGTIGSAAATTRSVAALEDVNLLNGLITAKRVVAVSRSEGDGRTAHSSSVGSALIGLVIDGVSFGAVTPAENTRIDLPGIGAVVLNEQTQQGNGWRTSALTVNMIRLIIDGTRGGDVVVGSVHSGVTLPAPRTAAELAPARATHRD